jgi:hypothetical protein
MTASLAAPGQERRIDRRMRTLKPGRIVFNGGYTVFDCVVRNVSSGGALLDVASAMGIPGHFEIMIGGAAKRPCTVRWHTDHLIGVHFDDVRPAGPA